MSRDKNNLALVLPQDIRQNLFRIRRVVIINWQVQCIREWPNGLPRAFKRRRINGVNPRDDIGVNELASKFSNTPLTSLAQRRIPALR